MFEIIVPLVNNPTNFGVNDLSVRTTDTLGRQVIKSTSIHTLIRFNSTLSAFDIELFNDEAPITVANFFNDVDSYENSIVHRSPNVQFVQGGGFLSENDNIQSVAPQPSIINEFNGANENVRGTLSMALVPNSPKSGTSQWFFNAADNSATLDPNLNTAFSRVSGTGATILDAIDNIPDDDISSLLDSILQSQNSLDWIVIRGIPASFIRMVNYRLQSPIFLGV